MSLAVGNGERSPEGSERPIQLRKRDGSATLQPQAGGRAPHTSTCRRLAVAVLLCCLLFAIQWNFSISTYLVHSFSSQSPIDTQSSLRCVQSTVLFLWDSLSFHMCPSPSRPQHFRTVGHFGNKTHVAARVDRVFPNSPWLERWACVAIHPL